MAHAHARQRHDQVRQDRSEETTQAHQRSVDEAEEGSIVAGGHGLQRLGCHLVIFWPHDAVDEVHGEGHAIRVAQEVCELLGGGVLLIGGGSEPGVGLGRGGVDKRGVNVGGFGHGGVSVCHWDSLCVGAGQG